MFTLLKLQHNMSPYYGCAKEELLWHRFEVIFPYLYFAIISQINKEKEELEFECLLSIHKTCLSEILRFNYLSHFNLTIGNRHLYVLIPCVLPSWLIICKKVTLLPFLCKWRQLDDDATPLAWKLLHLLHVYLSKGLAWKLGV